MVSCSGGTWCCDLGGGDCNDNSAAVHPGATEICGNGIDEDCDGADDTAVVAPYFINQTSLSPAALYYVGDYIRYKIVYEVNSAPTDPDDFVINLTHSDRTILKTQDISSMTKQSTGVYIGEFSSHDLSALGVGEGIYLWVAAYELGSLTDTGVHADNDLENGIPPSINAGSFSYSTNAESNYTVEDLIVNSTFGKIDWSSSRLDVHERSINLDSAIDMADRLIYVDSASWPELNTSSFVPFSATLTFENVNCASPYVFYSETASTRSDILTENKQCLPPRCTDILCAGNTLTVTVSSFSGYAAEGNANLAIDADDPKLIGEEVHFTADYRNLTDGFISGANCTIYLPGETPELMAEGNETYTYNTTFVTEGIKAYNVTCSQTGFSTVTAFDNATITSTVIPEFSTMTLGLGLIAVLVGLYAMRKKR